MSVRIIVKCLSEGHVVSRRLLRVIPMTPTSNGMETGCLQRFKLDTEDNRVRVRVWRPRGKHINPALI